MAMQLGDVAPPEIDVAEANRRRAAGATLIDVREQVEWDAGRIAGSLFIPVGSLAQEIAAAAPDRDTEIVLYCHSGVRSGLGAQQLQGLGYPNVVNMAGGIVAWRAAGLPIEAPATLTPAQQARYSRHLLIPEVGTNGQAKLLDSKVLIVGAGGLGSPSALYLAAAGVGTLGIVDFDVVEASNLQRQVIHSTERLGQKKVESARRTIAALNPDVRVVAYDEMLLADNVERLIAGYDVILDGTDTFETRYLLNDAAVAAGIPVAHASVFRFEGQLSTFVPYEGPCYRCLYPTPPPAELAPGCSVAGVLGVVPGIMGMLQANEVLKLLLGIGEPLVGRLLLFDALDGSFSELRLNRDPACPVCSDEARAARERGAPLPLPVVDDQPFVLGGPR
jgi:molybdopterin/thiamine biosynthesis adenylyltransferase/rhodanese-related sulfurtransferase